MTDIDLRDLVIALVKAERKLARQYYHSAEWHNAYWGLKTIMEEIEIARNLMGLSAGAVDHIKASVINETKED